MKFLIAGFGSIGRRHFRNLVSLGEDDILFLRSHRGNLPDDEIGDFPVYTDLNSALGQNPDAVIISNPSSMHLDVAIPAAECGCDILVEKPLADSMDKIPQFVKAVRKSGSKVLVGFQFRYHPGLIRIQDLLTEEVIGRILSVRAHWGEYLPNWHPWEDYRRGYSGKEDLGGGVILTLCHPLDYLRWLIGEVEALWAFSGKLGDLDLEVEDTAEIGLRFSDGAYGSLHLSYNQKPTTHHMEIVGTAGTIRWDNNSGIASFYQSDAGNWQDLRPPDGFERNDLFLGQMHHFLAVIRGDLEPACSLEDGIKALELALAAKNSAASGLMFEMSPGIWR